MKDCTLNSVSRATCPRLLALLSIQSILKEVANWATRSRKNQKVTASPKQLLCHTDGRQMLAVLIGDFHLPDWKKHIEESALPEARRLHRPARYLAICPGRQFTVH
jgi:hypothetical protein